jgi:hypothetical protein
MQNVYGEYLKEREHKKDLSIDGNILKCKVEFILMKVRINGGFL